MSQRAFKNYGKIDITPFKKILSENVFDWDYYDVRQKKQGVHKETKAIPILFDEINTTKKEMWDRVNEGDELVKEEVKTIYYDKFKDEILKIEDHLKEIIQEEGYIYRALIVNLPKGKKIAPHYDKGEWLSQPRRIHIPIQTNKDCFFKVGEVTKNLKEGEVWEIDNAGQLHSVENNGAEDRLHLIVDFIKN
jgi:hypothetical protein